MRLLVDTSVWSLAFRRDSPSLTAEALALKKALESGDEVFITGIILQELLQGFIKPQAQDQIVEYFHSLPLLTPDFDDHIKAAALRNQCRTKGIQVTTVDALLAQLCIRHELEMLTTDKDFTHISRFFDLAIWHSATN